MNLFILFFFITRIVAENPQFITCRKSIDCGKIRNISYPFFDGITRPDYCGYPGFELKCFNGNPLITISNQEFNLLGINNNTIRISMTNFSSTNACPIQLLNTSIDFSNFSFTALDQNITFYGCKQAVPTSPLIALNCDFLGSWSTGYYLTRSMLEKNNGELDLWGNCKSVVIPILQSAAKLIDQSLTLPALVKSLLKAFEAGFELGLIATTGLCSSCIGSGGACGFDSGARKFVCYCAAGNSSFICDPDGPDPVPNQAQAPNIPEIVDATGKKHNVTPLAIGASIGALFVAALVIGCCYLVLQQRRKHQILQDEASQNPIPSSGNVGLIPVRASEPLSSQAYTSSSSATYSHSLSSYASSTHEDERASAYFGVHVFDYSDLQQATSGFNKELGSGGYGSVYYGQLPDGRLVAVKRLYENSFRRIEQFMNEIEILARMRHKNLVTLYGCTSKKSRVLVLVYEYVPNGTVADHLHGKHAETAFLKWPIRLSIAVETAEALAYLHRSGVIHRDVKTTNILLDNDFHVKVADFGLSRLFHNDATHVSTFPQGTPGYVDPDYYNCFRLTEKSDVYSFGVILIELISSMQAVDGARDDHVNLASMALDRIQNRALHELVDPQLGFQSDPEIQRMVKMVAELGFRCLQPEKDMRPTMEEAATTLRGIQMVKANSIRQEGMVVVACGDDVGLLKGIRA